MISTDHPKRQHRTLAMNIRKDMQLQFTMPSFCRQPDHADVRGQVQPVRCVLFAATILQPAYTSFCVNVSKPMFTILKLIDKYRSANTAKMWTTPNMPLCVLNDYGQPYFLSRSDVDLIPRSRRLMGPELHHYCGMLIDFVCRLPVLDTS
ncbi:hypothetical protein GGI08_000942 [Coemansia sp. S2]|nr:hypothetical protein GGI08_000942 [Coemansia sp. S2]KAJ2071511.1 hypothetical protein GGH13_003302 [Coemansia sp. S155-1]KAJ2352041.1 hypothetical protein GGH92_001495 [Coemansia sp. RSA 2673]